LGLLFDINKSASEDSLGGVRADAGRWASLEQCVNETCAVGVSEGDKVAPEPILTALEGLPNGFRSSMQKDVAAGRVPELDAITGPILRGGSEHGIEVSVTRSLVERVVALE
jgi:2-dehydropantoate 2-reductase